MKFPRPRPIAKMRRGLANVQEARERPAVIIDWIKASLVRMWRIRGGGFYGLGFVAAFVILETRSVVTEVGAMEGLGSFFESQLPQLFFRFLRESFLNFMQAFLWPLLFLELVGSWGIPALVGAFLGFDRWGKPAINRRIPELAAPAADAEDLSADED